MSKPRGDVSRQRAFSFAPLEEPGPISCQSVRHFARAMRDTHVRANADTSFVRSFLPSLASAARTKYRTLTTDRCKYFNTSLRSYPAIIYQCTHTCRHIHYALFLSRVITGPDNRDNFHPRRGPRRARAAGVALGAVRCRIARCDSACDSEKKRWR